MKKQSVLFLIVITILAMLFIAACGGSSPATNQPQPTAPPTSNSETVNEEPTAEELATTDTGGEETGSDGPTLDENGVPSDVPLMPAMYDLHVEVNNTHITYKVDGTIQEVVDFYTAELPAMGWNKILGADSAFGSMGTLSRQNDQTDKLSILLSFNPNGNYVNVNMDVIRAR